MATFSQFKSKYIIEKREPLRGDSLNKNIIKKLVTDPIEKNKEKLKKIDNRIKSDLNIPDDGGKAGQARIEKEFGLNDKNKTFNQEISRRRSAETTRGDAINRSLGTSGSTEGAGGANTGTKPKFSSGAQGTSPSGSPEMGGESKKFVQNRRKRLQTKVLKTQTKNVVQPDKFSDVVKKFQGSTSNTSNVGVSDQIKKIQQDYLNKLKDQKPKVNVNQTPTTNPSLPNFTKQKTNFSGRIGNVTNITKNKGAQLPNFKSGNPIKDTSYKKEIQRIFDRDRLNRGLKNLDTSDFDKQKLSKRAFQDFRKDAGLSSIKTKVAKSPRLAKALKFGGPVLGAVDSAITFRNTYKQSQAQGDTKARSVGKAASKVAGGLIGGALGATAGSAIGPGGTYVGGVGGYVAGQKAGEKLFDTLTTSKGRKQLAKSFKNFRDRAMKPVGS